ncbi:hypothetical protein K474DRAFT_1695307 [Panus rudis PR-1116 ss-1]|nr:hypothetical protein K474DRAFT_1695307 [Panus rudis PR-1116 ss-1]
MISQKWMTANHHHESPAAHAVHNMYPFLGVNPTTLIFASFTITIVGDFLLVTLLATLMFGHGVRKRNATLLNLLAVSVLVSVPPELLFVAGQDTNPVPPKGLCLTQAVLKHGSDPMFVVASLALVIEFLQATGVVILRWVLFLIKVPYLIALPYITFAIFAIITLALGVAHPQEVKHEHSKLYCSIETPFIAHGIDIFSVVIAIFTIGGEVLTVLRIYKNRESVKESNNHVVYASQIIRITSFTLVQFMYIIMCAIAFQYHSTPTHVIPVVWEALMPLVTFLIFGTTSHRKNIQIPIPRITPQ